MFLNILRISASNGLRMFSNIIVSIGVQLLFFVRTNQPEAQTHFIELTESLYQDDRDPINPACNHYL